ncbi:MAG: hypothetical protein ACK5Q5_17845 [Planctomycetaceae bacterium]
MHSYSTLPTPLLTVRRISQLTSRPVSLIRRILDEHPGIQPRAIADRQPIYDRTALASITSILDQLDAAGGAK